MVLAVRYYTVNANLTHESYKLTINSRAECNIISGSNFLLLNKMHFSVICCHVDQGTHSQDSLYRLESLICKDTKPGGYAWLIAVYVFKNKKKNKAAKFKMRKQDVDDCEFKRKLCVTSLSLIEWLFKEIKRPLRKISIGHFEFKNVKILTTFCFSF